MKTAQMINEQENSMIRELEIEAITVEEAIKKALACFKTDRNNVNIKVLREEKRGLFGMNGSNLAKIKVTRK